MGPALPLPPALSRGGAIGRVVVCFRWCAMWELGGCARALTCVASGPRGAGVPVAVRCGGVGAGARGAALPLPPVLPPRARAGLRMHGLSARGAKNGDSVADRVTPGGAVCVGGVPRASGGGVRCAGLSATGGCCAALPWWLCVTCGHARVPVWWEVSASSLLEAIQNRLFSLTSIQHRKLSTVVRAGESATFALLRSLSARQR